MRFLTQRKRFDDLSEQEILALAISSEEDDAQIYRGYAERLRADTAALVRESGFAEYFSPETAEGAGGGSFSWTAAIWLTWASPSHVEQAA